MCDFASFLITDKGEIKVFDMLSHRATAEYFKLKPETYREVEWIGNIPESLEVRTLDTDSIVFKRARESILSMFPTRQDFLDKYMTEEVQLRMVKNDGYAIMYIENPTEAVQLKAIKQNEYIILYIKNPSEAVQLEAVKNDSNAIIYISNPSEAVQLAAVKNDGYAIDYIENPTQKVLDYVKNILDF